jgi:hypothetical protein
MESVRLGEEVLGAQLQGLDRHMRVGGAAQHDDWGGRRPGGHPGDDV